MQKAKIAPSNGSKDSFNLQKAASESIPLRLCGAPHNRNYAKCLVMHSNWWGTYKLPVFSIIFTKHNYYLLFKLNIAKSLSGALNLPR